MLAAERRIQIMNTLMKTKIVHTHILAQDYAVSEMTIRRDLNYLAKDGALIRTHGGALFNEEFTTIANYNNKRNTNLDEKMMIAEYAASLIQDGQTIAINTSTITVNIAKFILDKKITLVTNSLEVVNIVSNSKSINLIITSGTFVREYRSFEGSKTINDFSSYTYDLSFIGTNGITKEGIYTGGSVEAEAKKVILKESHRTFILAEHTKFGLKGQHKIADFNDSTILTSSLAADAAAKHPNILMVDALEA